MSTKTFIQRRRKMVKVLLALMLLSVAGCATNRNSSNYAAYLDAMQKIESTKSMASETRAMSRDSQYDAMLAKCSTDSCVGQVAAFKAIADTVDSLAGNGGKTAAVAAPQREPTFSDKALAWASVLVPGVTQYASIVENGKTQRHLSDNTATVQESQNSMWATIMSSQSESWAQVAAIPSVSVGGNYGDTAGTSLTSGDGNVVGNQNNNSGRFDSNGPYDYSGDCRDTGTCSSDTP